MKFKFLLFLCLFMTIGMKAETPFAVYNMENESLLFLCSDTQLEKNENQYGNLVWQIDLNQGNKIPEWHNSKAINATTVEFDESFKNVRTTSCYCWFDGFANLSSVIGLENFNTSSVTDMDRMFAGCSKLTKLSLTDFNTSRVRSMQDMFASCTNLNTLDLSTFNTVNVTNMEGMFSGCSSISNIYVCDKFTTESVSSSADMFAGCSKLKNFDSFSTDKTHAAKGDESYLSFLVKYPYAFYYPSDSSLHFLCFNTKLSISGSLDIVAPKAKSTNIWAVELNQEDNYPSWSDSHASEANKIIIEPSFNTVSPNSISHWFDGFKNLQSIEGLENLDTSSVKNMAGTFSGCSDLKLLIMNNFNVINVTNMDDMFSECVSLRLVDLSQAESDCSKIIDQISEDALVYVPLGTTVSHGRKNVVVGDRCEHLVINNGSNSENPDNQLLLSIPYAFTTDAVSINRSFVKDSPRTLCMPFALPEGLFGTFYTFDRYNEDKRMVVCTQLSDELSSTMPNTPYIFKPNDDYFDGIEIIGEIEISETMEQQKSKGFIGVYEKKILTKEDIYQNSFYRWSDSAFEKMEEGDSLYACNAYLILPADSSGNVASRLSVRFEDNVTGATISMPCEEKVSDSLMYDLVGRRVSESFKGVIIQKGKKIIKH